MLRSGTRGESRHGLAETGAAHLRKGKTADQRRRVCYRVAAPVAGTGQTTARVNKPRCTAETSNEPRP